MRPSILLVGLFACSNQLPTIADRDGVREMCANEPICVAYHVVPVSPGAHPRGAYDFAPFTVDADLELGAFHLLPPATRAALETSRIAAPSPRPPIAYHFARGIGTGQLLDGASLALLDSDLDQRAKQHVAGGLISLGAPHGQSYAVLQDGLLSNDPAVVSDAVGVIKQVAPAIPASMQRAFAVLLREHGESAALRD